MSESKNIHGVNEDSIDKVDDEVAETDLFASLNKMLDENPEFKSIYESVMSILGDDPTSEERTEVECVEIDGYDYIIARKFESSEITYLYLVNEDDVLDFIIQNVIVEDGEEYATGLDSEKEFDLVLTCIQRDFLMQLKGKAQKRQRGQA